MRPQSSLLAALALAACATAPPPVPSALTGTAWIRRDDEQASPHDPTLTITGTAVSGYTGCGAYTAHVRAGADGKLSFSAITVPVPRCDAGAARAAQISFLNALHRTRAARLENDELVLLDAVGHQAARFTR